MQSEQRWKPTFGANIIFVPSCVRVWNGWALVSAEPQRRGGRKIDPRILSDWDNRDGIDVTALLRFRYGRWNLVDHGIGATDVWYDGIAPRPADAQPLLSTFSTPTDEPCIFIDERLTVNRALS